MSAPLWAWFAAVGVIGVLLASDIALHHLRSIDGIKPALVETAGWIALSVAFGVVLGLSRSWGVSSQYFAAYLLEKSLSIDNVVVFALLFNAFEVPLPHRRRVLYWGVVGALVLRGAFIAAGGAFVGNVSWAFYPFGAIVLIAGVRMARGGAHVDVERGRLVRVIRRIVPIAPGTREGAFFTRQGGRIAATPLLLALVAIEATDVIFATDSIPAVFGITTDVFVVFTSNAFAVLGLRSLYFVLADALDQFTYLTKGLAVLLVFIGLKMLVRPVFEIPTTATLGTIVAVVGLAIAASLRRSDPGERRPEKLR